MQSRELQAVPLFSRLGKHEIATLGQLTDEIDVEPGKVLAREGDFGREFFVIRSGTAEVVRGGEHVADLGPGDFFGEIALIEEERRTATVTMTSSGCVVVLSRAAFSGLKHTMPQIHAVVREEIVKRRAVPS